MISLSDLSLLAEDAATPPAGGGTQMMVMMVLMFAMMYFLIIRPQRRQRQEHEARIRALKSGDKVVTSGGIYGLITNVKDATIILKVAESVRIEVDKASIATVLSKSEEADPVVEAPTEQA